MKNLTLFFLLFFISFNGFSQVEEYHTDSLYVLTMNSGETRIGKIVSDDGREILLMSTEIGKIYIRKENIKSITPYILKEFQNVNGELRAAGPFTTRYCFTTNSLPIKKNENYALVNLYGPEVHFAVSNRFSIGVMSTWIASPFILAAKYTIPTKNDKLNFGFGTLMGTSGYLNTFRGFGGLHWGMVTYGDRMNNITFSAGFSYLKTGEEKSYSESTPGIYESSSYSYPSPSIITYSNPMGTAPVIGLGGIAKVGKKASFIFDAMVFFGTQKKTEFFQDINFFTDPVSGINYKEIKPGVLTTSTVNNTIAFFMPAMRFQTMDNKAFQVALAGCLYKSGSNSQAFPIPMVSWFFKF
jgi:hypothetical protein